MSDSERSLDRSGGPDHRWSPSSTPNLAEDASERADEEETVSDELAAFHGLSGWSAGGLLAEFFGFGRASRGEEVGVGGHLKTRAGPVFAEWDTRRRAMRDSMRL